MSPADAAEEATSAPSLWPLVLPFIVNFAVVAAALLATWAVTRRARTFVGEQLPINDERWKQVPTAARPAAIEDLLSWAIDAVASLTCIIAPLAGFLVLFPMTSWPLEVGYAIAGLANLVMFLWVLLGTSPSEYVMKPSEHLPAIITVVPLVAVGSTLLGLGLTLLGHALGWLD